ncbi:MAG: phosphotransferase [Acidobacteria bacterium]|nr:phosphotransferase [Acidobacteriota bacterium]
MAEELDRHLGRIRECLPHLVIETVRENRDGLTNDVLIVNEQFVFRFPKNETWARELLANEIKVIELARDYLDIQIPHIECKAADLLAYRFIAGGPLQRNDILALGEDEQDAIADQLATYLRQLHAVPLGEVGRHGIAPSDTNRGRAVWLELFEDAKRELSPSLMSHAREWVEQHFAPLLADEGFMNYEPRLINGEPTPYHVLFDRQARRVSGVIDFGTAGVGDPAADFAVVIYYYGESFLRRMAKFYPEIKDGLDRARFWAGTLELQWALSGVRGRSAAWSWFTVHLGGARDVLPVGVEWEKA